MDLGQTEIELTGGLNELIQNLNNVRAELVELDQQRIVLENRILSQRGALSLLAKLMEEEPEPLLMGEDVPEGVVTPEMIEEGDTDA